MFDNAFFKGVIRLMFLISNEYLWRDLTAVSPTITSENTSSSEVVVGEIVVRSLYNISNNT